MDKKCSNCRYNISGMCSSTLYLQEIASKATYVVLEDRTQPCAFWTLSPRFVTHELPGRRPGYLVPSSGDAKVADR